MKYSDFLKTIKACPFCYLNDKQKLLQTDRCVLTYALAPYHKHHLLITPKKHCSSILDLDSEEESEIDWLQNEAIKILKYLGHKSYSILVREGDDSDKTVEHLHYHIIPDISLGSGTSSGAEREVLGREEQERIFAELKSGISRH